MENNGTNKITVEEIINSDDPHLQFRVWQKNCILAKVTLAEEKVREGEEGEIITARLTIKCAETIEQLAAAAVIKKTLQYLKETETDILIFEILKIETDNKKIIAAARLNGFEQNGDESLLAIKRERYLKLVEQAGENNQHIRAKKRSTDGKIFPSKIAGRESQIKIVAVLLRYRTGLFREIIKNETGINSTAIAETIKKLKDMELLTLEPAGRNKRIIPKIKEIHQRLEKCGIVIQQMNAVGQQ